MSLIDQKLLAFIAVVENKTVHAAAKALHLTQTAVTQRIRNLENQLKTTLFLRSRRGMQLTAEGAALLKYCHAIKSLEGETTAEISGMALDAETELKISGPSSIMRSRVVPALKTINQLFPKLRLWFDFNDEEQLPQKLRFGEFDFIITTDQDITDELTFKKLIPEKYVLVCCEKWKKRALKDIIQHEPIIDFHTTDKMTYNYLNHFGLMELASKNRHFVNNIDSMAELVEAGMGYTTLTKETAQIHLQNKEMTYLNKGQYFKYQPVLAWYARVNEPKYFKELIKRIN